MTDQVTYPLINGDAVRATILDSCGVPAWGNAVYTVTDGFTQVAVSENWDDGTEISIKNAKGRSCVKRPAEAELQNLTVSVTLCKADPALYTALTGRTAITDDAGKLIGFTINRGVLPSSVHLMLEVWMDAFAEADCDESGDLPYGWFGWPHLTGGRVGDYTIENNAVTFQITNMITKDSGITDWPYEVASDSLGAAQALFDAIDALDHQITLRTVIAPPENTVGLVPLDDPDDTDATTATAGTPGTFDGVRPADLAGMSGITASPTTAWTTGQFVYLGDGSKAHWNATAWVAGAA